MRVLALPALVLWAAAGLAQPDATEQDLGAGDSIRVTVFQSPDLTTEVRVAADGAISFPLIGRIEVAGLTVAETGERIADELRSGGFVRNPQVSVAIVDVRSRRVSVLGHVARPGQYPLDSTSLSLTDLLAQAGGITDGGDDKVIVMSKRNGEMQRFEIDVPAMYLNGDLTSNIELKSGDTVFVPAAPMFYVYGAVQRAGAYRLEPGTLVHNALSLGGGLTARGSERGIEIHRRMPDGTVEELDARLVDPVQADDVIHVKESIF